MAVSVTAALLTVREFLADERRALLEDFCIKDPGTGQPVLSTMCGDEAAIVDEYDELLAVADGALIAAGIDPQPQRTNVTVLPVLHGRNLRLIQSGDDDGPRAA
jgi:hypothetical protein